MTRRRALRGGRLGRPARSGDSFTTSGELGAEADVALAHAVEHDVDPPATDHPLEAVVAVLALEEPGLDELREHLEALHALGRGREGGGDARPGAHPLEPGGEARARPGRVAGVGEALDIGGDRQVAPPEGPAVEPGPIAELPLEVALHARRLLGAAGEESLGERTAGALEDADLHRGPADRLDVGVAQLLEHAHARALGGGGGEERRRRPAVLDVLEDDGRVEDPGVAVHQRGHLEARVGGREGVVPPAHEVGQPALDGDALLGERDLDLLRVGRERMLVEENHGRGTRADSARAAQGCAPARPALSTKPAEAAKGRARRTPWPSASRRPRAPTRSPSSSSSTIACTPPARRAGAHSCRSSSPSSRAGARSWRAAGCGRSWRARGTRSWRARRPWSTAATTATGASASVTS